VKIIEILLREKLLRSIRNAVGRSLFTSTFRSCPSRRTKRSRQTEPFVPLPNRLDSWPASLPIRLFALTFCFGLMSAARAQTPDQQQPLEPKLPPVRCTIVPTKDVVQWQRTPTTPVTPTAPTTPAAKEDQTEHRVETQNSENQLLNSKDDSSDADVSDLDSITPERQTPNAKNDCGLRTADFGLGNPQSAIRNSKFGTSTDTWFQISAPESSDIEETTLAASADDNNRAAPQPLAQVLADLARRAQCNFVDPGIPSTETITYNFADADLDPWEAFTRIAQTRGYRIVYRDDIVTLARNQQDPLTPVNPHTVKAEVWLNQSAKPRADRPGLAIQLADSNVAPKSKPQMARSLEIGRSAKLSLIDAQSERGDSTLRLTVNPMLLPNGNIEADFEIENAVPSADGNKGGTIRRTTKFTVELTPTKQAIEMDGILVPNDDPKASKQTWFQRLFRKKAPENRTAQMVVKLTVEPVPGLDTPVRVPKSTPGSTSSKTGIVLVPHGNQRTAELTSIEGPKH